MDLQFYLEAFEFMMILSFMWTKGWPCIYPSASPPDLSFLNDSTKKKKKSNRKKSQKFF